MVYSILAGWNGLTFFLRLHPFIDKLLIRPGYVLRVHLHFPKYWRNHSAYPNHSNYPLNLSISILLNIGEIVSLSCPTHLHSIKYWRNHSAYPNHKNYPITLSISILLNIGEISPLSLPVTGGSFIVPAFLFTLCITDGCW